MKVREFLSDRWLGLAGHIIAALLLAVFLRLTGTSGGVVTIVLLVWTGWLLVGEVIAYYRQKNYLETLAAVMDGLEQRYLFAECIPRPKNHYQRKIHEFMRRSGKSMIEAVAAAERQQREYREYIENWVHEIKVPITTIQLICQNNSGESSDKVTVQLKQIEEHVERAMYYARLGSVEKDFIIKAVNLQEIASQAIKKQQTLLIQSGIKIETAGLEQTVYTDQKWVIFILSQLLANAVRYRSEQPLIRITAKAVGSSVVLKVWDNGIGIPEHELKRIFERGFTGSNGRSRGGSTGMGLYICKQLADFLRIELSTASAEGTFTSITLVFPGKSFLTKS